MSIIYEITPPNGLLPLNLSELWRFKDLLYIFVWRDIKIRYKQTALGVLWAILQPVITMVIFTVFFGNVAKVPSEGIPYAIFVYTGLLFWNYFSIGLTSTSNSMIESEHIIKKVYFPRLVLPLSTVVTPLIDFVLAFVILLGLMAYYHFSPSYVGLLLVPVLLIFSLITTLGLGLFLAALNVRFRDVRYLLPFFLQMLLFLTPVIYPVSSVPAKFQWILFLNPMAGIVSLARYLILGIGSLDWNHIAISGIAAILIFLIGLIVFTRSERSFADIL